MIHSWYVIRFGWFDSEEDAIKDFKNKRGTVDSFLGKTDQVCFSGFKSPYQRQNPENKHDNFYVSFGLAPSWYMRWINYINENFPFEIREVTRVDHVFKVYEYEDFMENKDYTANNEPDNAKYLQDAYGILFNVKVSEEFVGESIRHMQMMASILLRVIMLSDVYIAPFEFPEEDEDIVEFVINKHERTLKNGAHWHPDNRGKHVGEIHCIYESGLTLEKLNLLKDVELINNALSEYTGHLRQSLVLNEIIKFKNGGNKPIKRDEKIKREVVAGLKGKYHIEPYVIRNGRRYRLAELQVYDYDFKNDRIPWNVKAEVFYKHYTKYVKNNIPIYYRILYRRDGNLIYHELVANEYIAYLFKEEFPPAGNYFGIQEIEKAILKVLSGIKEQVDIRVK